jgi:PAS domain S-box-containing protein
LTAAALLVVVIAVVFIAQRFVQPIQRLTQSAQELSAGNFAAEIPVQSNDEIGQLADSFRAMSGELQNLIGSLETRVNERTRDLATTIEVGKLANSIYDQAELLPELVEFIRSRFGLYYTQIYLLDEAGKFAVLRAGTGEVGQELLGRNHRLEVAQTSLVSQAIKTGQSVIVADTAASKTHKPNALLPDTRSEVAIPLRVGNETLGVLDLQASRANTFTEDNASVFEAMAGQIAAVLRGMQAFEQARVAAQRAEDINARLTSNTWQSYFEGLQDAPSTGYRYDLEAPQPIQRGELLNNDNDKRTMQPITVRGATIGYIAVQDEERVLDEQDHTLIQDTARLVATALDQFRSFDEVRRSEAETRRVQSFLDSVIESLPIMVFVKDARELRFVSMNRAGEELTGFSRGQLIGKNDYDFFPKEEADFFIEKDLQVLGSNEVLDIPQEEIRTVDGRIRLLHTKKLAIRDADGKPQYLIGISEDITEARAAEEALRLRQRAIESSTSGITIADMRQPDMPLIYVNEAFSRVTGYSVEEAVGRNCRFLQNDDRDQVDLPELRAALKEGRDTRVTLRNYRKNGEMFYNELQVAPVFDAQGTLTHFVGVSNDVTERIVQQQEITAARNRAETLARLNAALSQATDETEILASIEFYASELQNPRLTLSYINTNTKGEPVSFTTVASWRESQPWLEDPALGATFQIKDLPSSQEWINNPSAIYQITDGETDPRLDEVARATMRMLGFQSITILPLMSAGQWQGFVSLNWPHPYQLPADSQDILTNLLQPLSAVVSSRRAYLAEETLRTRAELLSQTNAMLSQASDEDEILSAVALLAEREGVSLSNMLYVRTDENNLIAQIETVAVRSSDGKKLPVEASSALVFNVDEYPLVKLVNDSTLSPVIIEDIQQDNRCDQAIRAFAQAAHIGAAIVMPLRTGTRWIGILSFTWTNSRSFNLDVRERFNAVLPTASSVSASRYAYLESVEAQLEAETLYRVSATINESTNEAEIINAVVRYIAPKEAFAVTLSDFVRDEEGVPTGYQVMADWQRMGGSTVGTIVPLEMLHLPTNLRNDEVVVYGNTQTHPELDADTRDAFRSFGIGALIAAPVALQNRVFGLLNIVTDTPYSFSERDIRIFRSAAELAAVALDRLALTQETERRAIEMETVAQVSAVTTTILDLDELLLTVAELTKARFDLYHAHVYLLDEAQQMMVLAAGAGDAGRMMKERGHAIPMSRQNSLVVKAARERRGVIANDVTGEEDFLPNPLLPETRSELALPLIVGDRLIGVLDTQDTRVGRFTESDVRVKAALADQIAVAVENARAFREQQTIAERLRDVDKLKSQFLANMSHELRTPLNSIIGYAEVLIDGIDGDLSDEAVEDVEAIHSSGKHLLTIINDILDLAKIEAGQMFMDRREVDLMRIIQDVMNTLDILARNKGIELRLSVVDNVPTVYGDAIRLKQVVLNLVNNAIKFTELGSVTVEVAFQDTHTVALRVRDTGIGMEGDDLESLFQRFHQVDGSPTRRAGGTGLGLVISKQIMNMHGGDIIVESQKGVGSVFWFTLPVYNGQGATESLVKQRV